MDRKIAEERLATRGTCEKCDLIFNLTIQDVCPRCNVKLQPRLDAMAKGRQEGFEEKFAASFAYFKNRLVEIDGNKPTAECLKALKLPLFLDIVHRETVDPPSPHFRRM